MNCVSCRHSHVNELDNDEGFVLQCRRHPPQIAVLDGMVIQAWPQVDENDVCGEGQEAL